jgi:hypothetical protein
VGRVTWPLAAPQVSEGYGRKRGLKAAAPVGLSTRLIRCAGERFGERDMNATLALNMRVPENPGVFV